MTACWMQVLELEHKVAALEVELRYDGISRALLLVSLVSLEINRFCFCAYSHPRYAGSVCLSLSCMQTSFALRLD